MIIASDPKISDPTTTPENRPFEQRSPSALTDRVLILGLDGATFDVLEPLMNEGHMPRLKDAVETGASGVLQSTVPPITPAAWTTFLTGKQPGSHGVIDFERFDVFTNKLSFNSTRTLEGVRNLWRILSDRGLRVGSINVPMTYPAFPVNGFLVSGFETPGVQSDFVYPPELKGEILARWPDPTLRARWQHRVIGGRKVFERNLAYIVRSFEQGAAMSRYCGDKFGWDVLMVVLKLVDNLQHKTWKYLDPRWSHRDLSRRSLVRDVFRNVDLAVGNLLDYADAHKATVLVVSDHGHGSLDGKIQPNLLLRNWGYLALRGGTARGATRGRYLWDRALGRTKRFARVGDIEQDLAVDFSKTVACVMHAGMAGFLYINLRGRQPDGIVPPSEYERLRDELIARFLGDSCRVRDTAGNRIALFQAVHKPEELYGVSRIDQPWLPDLMLIPRPGMAVVRKIRGRRPVRWFPYRHIEGTHRPEGILIASGPAIAARRNVTARLVDCAPTVLSMLGLPIPSDMEGNVLADLFNRIPHVEKEIVRMGRTTAASPEEVYSARELEQVTARLADLGYLE